MSDVEIMTQDAWRRREETNQGRVPAGTVWVGGEDAPEQAADPQAIEGLQPGVVPATYWK